MRSFIFKRSIGLFFGLFLLLVPGFFIPKLALAETLREPFFSEYIEGSSNNKALEIYNPNNSPLDLTGYKVEKYVNGSAVATNIVTFTSGSIAAYDIYVICNTNSISSILNVCDLPTGTLNVNGNDTVVLSNGSTILDVIGQIGYDPASEEWGSGLTSTMDNTLVRKCGIVKGDANGGDAFDPSIEWNGYAIDTFTYLGSHTLNCPVICGDYVIDVGEECDDGNVQDGDGCSSTCQNEVIPETNCSDGIDNDGDVEVDCDDSDCANDPLCAPAAVCGNGIVEQGEDCDGEVCCDSNCTFKTSQMQCRAEAGPCDIAENCSGFSSECPTDMYADNAIFCRTSASLCDIAESCSGSSPACPPDENAPVGTACSDGNQCNGDETCSDTGVCMNGTAPVCDPYTCNPDVGCYTSCDGDIDCQTGYLCDASGQCVKPQEELPGSISGVVYFDKDKDNIWDGIFKGEPKFSGWKVFIDQNLNNKFDRGERFEITSGPMIMPFPNYHFDKLIPGSYQICEIPWWGFTATLLSHQNCQIVSLGSGENKTGINFGNNFRIVL